MSRKLAVVFLAMLVLVGAMGLKTAVTVHAHKFSKGAQKAIEAAGGKAVVIGGEAAPAA